MQMNKKRTNIDRRGKRTQEPNQTHQIMVSHFVARQKKLQDQVKIQAREPGFFLRTRYILSFFRSFTFSSVRVLEC